MTLTLISPPAAEPVTLDDIKAHLRLTTNDDDSSVAQLLVAARHALEARAGLAFLTQHWTYTIDGPSHAAQGTEVILPLTPILSIDAVTATLSNGARETLDPNLYSVQIGSIGRVRINGALPGPLKPLGGVEIAFSAGHDNAALIPAELRHAIRLLTAHFFENRESAGEARVFSIPRTIDALIAPYRRISL